MTIRAPSYHVPIAVALVYAIGKVMEMYFTEEKFVLFRNESIKVLEKKGTPASDGHNKWIAGEILNNWTSCADRTDVFMPDRKIIFCSHCYLSMYSEDLSIDGKIIGQDDVVCFQYRKEGEAGDSGTRFMILRPPYTEVLKSNARYPTEENLDCVVMPSSGLSIVDWFKRSLSNGYLKSCTINHRGIEFSTPANFWLTMECEDVLRYDVHTSVSITDSELVLGRVFLDIRELDKSLRSANELKILSDRNHVFRRNRIYYSVLDSSEPAPAPALLLPNKGGAPHKYDEPLFVMLATKIAFDYNNGKPSTRAELARLTCASYVERRGLNAPPSEEWAKKKISVLWREWELGEDR